MKEWTQNRAEEIALEQTGYEFYELGSHLQLLCYATAQENWKDYYSSQIDYIYERMRDQLLGY